MEMKMMKVNTNPWQNTDDLKLAAQIDKSPLMDLPQSQQVKEHLVEEYTTNFIHQELASGSPLIHQTQGANLRILENVLKSPQFAGAQKASTNDKSDSDEEPGSSPLLIKRPSMGARAEQEQLQKQAVKLDAIKFQEQQAQEPNFYKSDPSGVKQMTAAFDLCVFSQYKSDNVGEPIEEGDDDLFD